VDSSPGIAIVDRVVLPRSETGAWLRQLHGEYRPIAEARGLNLKSVWATRAPAARAVEVMVVWTLPDVRTFWRARAGAADPSVTAWWQDTDAIAVARTRRVMHAIDVMYST
jgi:hypothetical protein